MVSWPASASRPYIPAGGGDRPALPSRGGRLVVSELPEVNLSPDPKDNPILATAIAGEAELIVSGDKGDMAGPWAR